ncbi:MAG TPA: hypothetical protein VG713_06080 [Pirellulales bacterium]|nr:hypothetical protein [Pirellulales bacterium]
MSAILLPKFLVLDTATLAKASCDYSSSRASAREKARTWVNRLQDNGVYISFALTHIIELIRHEDRTVFNDRLGFLRSLPQVAWVQPYDRNWFPGSIVDVFVRELHALIHDAKNTWKGIVDCVRPDFWQTGTGEELFVDDDVFWSVLRRHAIKQLDHQQYIASLSRTDPGRLGDLTIGELAEMPIRPKEERPDFAPTFVRDLEDQLKHHGDRRFITSSHKAAAHFVLEALRRVESIEAKTVDSFSGVLENWRIPSSEIRPSMTVKEVGELGVYIAQLDLFAQKLIPRANVTIGNAPPDSLPSYVLQRKLVAVQERAERVSGSDLGDRDFVPLALYANGLEVDKRTHSFLGQVVKRTPSLRGLIGEFFRCSNYSSIPEQIVCGN